jgi:anti-sigma B factor antagonist
MNDSTAPAPKSQILAATIDGCTLVAVLGMATFKLAPAFRQATQAAKLAGSHLIVVDMAACSGMDSTFMGTIASLGFAAKKPDGTPTAFINLVPRTAALLKGLGVDRIVHSYPIGSMPEHVGELSALVDGLRPVTAAPQESREMAAMMYDAHETLSRVDPGNVQRFKDVLAFLREDLRRLDG